MELELCVYFNAVRAQPHSCAVSSLRHMIVVQVFERLYNVNRWVLSLESRCTFARPKFVDSNLHIPEDLDTAKHAAFKFLVQTQSGKLEGHGSSVKFFFFLGRLVYCVPISESGSSPAY